MSLFPGLRPQHLWADLRWTYAQVAAASPRLFRAYCVNMLVSVAFPAGIALALRGLVNAVSAGLETGTLDAAVTVWWLALGFAMNLGSGLSFNINTYLARRFQLELQPRLSEHILRRQGEASFAQFEQQSYRDALARAQDAPEVPVAQLCGFTLELLAKLMQALSLVVILLVIEPLLFALLLPVAIPYLLFQWRMSRRQFDEVDQRVAAQRRMRYYRGLLSSLDHFGEIKALGLAGELRDRFATLLAQFKALAQRSQNLEFAGRTLFSMVSTGAVYIALGFAAFNIVDGRLTIGDLAIFGSAAQQLRSLLEQGVNLVASSRWQLLHVRRLREFLDLPLPPPASGRAPPATLAGEIEFRGVSFRYPGTDEDVLSDVSFRIGAGEMVALVGRNGAGKSTVAKLLAGFYQPTGGEIRIGGCDMRDWGAQDCGKVVSLVPQQFGRYQVSARDNIAFGDWERLQHDPAEVEEIARRAGVDAMISALPDGYDTILGRDFGAQQLSGGQWQQLAIARMMARDAPVLVLDEPTASLDAIAEAELFQGMRRLATGRTTLLISHRFSSVSMADRILVIDQGRIIESGTHQQLLAADGHYASLYRLATKQLSHA